MRGGVAVDFERFGILGGQDLNAGVLFERARQIVQFSVDLRDDGVVRQARADRSRDIEGLGTCWHGLLAAVGQRDGESCS